MEGSTFTSEEPWEGPLCGRGQDEKTGQSQRRLFDMFKVKCKHYVQSHETSEMCKKSKKANTKVDK